MNTKILVLSLASGWLVLMPGCATRGSSDHASFSDAPLPHRAVTMTVYGLSCPLCANNLDGQLARVEGVTDATIDLATGAVTVRLADGHAVSGARLARAVREAGFTLKTIAPAEPGG